MNKKGQQMTLGTIIAIVLGLVVLVFLIFGFTKGWGNLWDNITNLGSGDSNVNAVIRGCEVACASEDPYAFCTQSRTVNNGSGEEIRTCDYLRDSPDFDISCNNIPCN